MIPFFLLLPQYIRPFLLTYATLHYCSIPMITTLYDSLLPIITILQDFYLIIISTRYDSVLSIITTFHDSIRTIINTLGTCFPSIYHNNITWLLSSYHYLIIRSLLHIITTYIIPLSLSLPHYKIPSNIITTFWFPFSYHYHMPSLASSPQLPNN